MKKHTATSLHAGASMNVIKGSLAAFFFFFWLGELVKKMPILESKLI